MSHFQEPSPNRYSLIERSFRMAWNRFSVPQLVRTANFVLVVTPEEEAVKVKMGAEREKCILFPGGVDEDPYLRFASADPEELRRRLTLKPNAKLITYLGSIEERKNPAAPLR